MIPRSRVAPVGHPEAELTFPSAPGLASPSRLAVGLALSFALSFAPERLHEGDSLQIGPAARLSC